MFTEAAKSNLLKPSESSWRLAGFGLSQKISGYKPLSAVKTELEGIVKRDSNDMDGVIPGVIHLNDDFTENTFVDSLEKPYSAVHIASHFIFKPGAEHNSFLLLGTGEALSLAQIRRMKFRSVELLALSACNTGMDGRNANGREIEGFGTLAQRRGAKGVIATLWPVVDESTALFMRSFYKLRQESHLSKAEALRQAQVMFIHGKGTDLTVQNDKRGLPIYPPSEQNDANEILKKSPDSPYANPYYWAPFILMGHWL